MMCGCRSVWFRLALGVGLILSAGLVRAAEPSLKIQEVVGKVMLRTVEGLKKLLPGEELPTGGQSIVTSTSARVEIVTGDGVRWRIGALALCLPHADGGRLMAGTVLIDVPEGGRQTLDSTSGRAVLEPGLWIVQAVNNEGLKLICLDGPAVVVAGGGETAVGEDPQSRRLRPGELVFLRPGGLEFGPVVTIYLQELLATSRLVNGFSEPLPQASRLQTLAYVQKERLKGATNAFVAGAKDEEGFQLVVPEPRSR